MPPGLGDSRDVLGKVTEYTPNLYHIYTTSWATRSPNVYPRRSIAEGERMARPILRLATRFTRRTRATAWAIAFA
ncbi:MAG TPA: hypothetical protein VGA48_07900, partial [Thermoplasmata archaeon]